MKHTFYLKYGLIAFSYLFLTNAHAQEVTFHVDLTASGEETISEDPTTYSAYREIPSFYNGTALKKADYPVTKTLEYCLPLEVADCKINLNQSGGYTVVKHSVNSPGGSAQESFSLDTTTKCLTGDITLRSKYTQSAWYKADFYIHAICPRKQSWAHTQRKGPFNLNTNEGYKYITNYSGSIGSGNGLPNTAKVTHYSANIVFANPDNALLTHGMFQSSPADGDNGPQFYAYYGKSDLRAEGLEITQGVQNLYNDMPLVAMRRTFARFYVSSNYAVSDKHARLRAFKGAVELPYSPLYAERIIQVRSQNISRGELNHAFLFKIPYQWTQAGRVDFEAVVDLDNISTDLNSSNNYRHTSVEFKVGNHSADTIVSVPLMIHQNGDKDQPYYVYDNNSYSYRPIINNHARRHPVTDIIPFDCGIKPLKPVLGGVWDPRDTDDWSRMVNRVATARFFNGCGVKESFWHGMIHPSLNRNPDPKKQINGLANSNKKGTKKSSITFMSGIMDPNRKHLMPLGNTVAHEIAHNKGLDHVCNKENDDPDPDYPYNDTCEISRGNKTFFTTGHDGYYLIDVFHDLWGIKSPAIMPKDSSTDEQVFPMMSVSHNRWMSPYEYCYLLDWNGISCDKNLISQHLPEQSKLMFAKKPIMKQGIVADITTKPNPHPGFIPVFPIEQAILPIGYTPTLLGATADNYLLINAIYDMTKTTANDFSLMKLKSVPGAMSLEDSNQFQQDLIDKNTNSYSNVLVLNQYNNSTSRQLLKADIVADFGNDESEFITPEKYINQVVLAANGAAYFELNYGSHVIASKTVSSNPPVISVNSFSESTLTDNSVIRWNASDVDNNPLSFSIYYRKDANSPWRQVDSNLTGNQYLIRTNVSPDKKPLSYYPASPTGMFRVEAYDGFHTTSANTNTIQVPNNPPQAYILQPTGLIIPLGSTLYLDGGATDTEDGSIPSLAAISAMHTTGIDSTVTQFEWSSSISGKIGQGYKLSRRLSRGNHLITLTVKDANGMTSTASIYVQVGVEDRMPDRNLALRAQVSASSTYCSGSDCYNVNRINDTSTNTSLGGNHSWTNNGSMPAWIELNWTEKMVITSSEVYTTTSYPAQNFELQYWNGIEWITFNKTTGNTSSVIKSNFDSLIVASKIRLLGLSGPNTQPQYFRVNEWVVKGHPLNATVKIIPI